MTSRGPLTLAALASAAVPGLDPDTVEGVVPSGPADSVEVAFIQDREHRRWVIRCPRTPAASAQLERSAALLTLLSRRLTMPVPAVKGWAALPEGGRAAVHTYLTGRLVTLEGVVAGSTLATGLGRTLAQLHNLDPSVYEEALVPVYDAASYRSRRLADLDRAAATGRVPTGLLGRWERVLDDESLWSFTTTPTHGAVGADTVLASPDEGRDPDVKALLGWESAQVADPADDLAPLLAALDPEAFDTVLEAYAHSRVERPDRHLQQRARTIGEMQLVRAMMTAVAAGDDDGAEECATCLRRLDDRVAREEEAHRAPERVPDLRPAERTEAAETQPVRTGPAAASGPPETAHLLKEMRSDDAVQVEHPATPVPVTPAPGAPLLADIERESPVDEAPVDEPATEPDAQPDADPAADPDPAGRCDGTAGPAPAATTGSAHDTAEIVPVDDPDQDDVVDPRRS